MNDNEQIIKTKKRLADILESEDRFFSGRELSSVLGLTRAAVWKSLRQLGDEGYVIDSSRKGYRLSPESDAVSLRALTAFLGDKANVYTPEVFQTIDSTNTFLREHAEEKPHLATAVARSQTGGRGRFGRTFISPPSTGVYLSVLYKKPLPFSDALKLTTAAAVAACRAIEDQTDQKASIKWVNDIYVEGKKTCGILTEAGWDVETGLLKWAVTGIGFNVYEMEGGFPEELKGKIGAITKKRQRDLRCRIVASFLREFYELTFDLSANSHAAEYRDRCFIIGQKITVLQGDTATPATALDVDDDCHLKVRYENGEEETLSSGEVSIKL